MRTPNAVEIAVKYAIENERLKLLAEIEKAKSLEELKAYILNLLKA